MLTAEQLKARDGKLTASRVACLMTGDAEKIMNLWREMVGDPSFVADDLSGVWPVQLGSATEMLNLDWYTRRTGRQSAPHSPRGSYCYICPGQIPASVLEKILPKSPKLRRHTDGNYCCIGRFRG